MLEEAATYILTEATEEAKMLAPVRTGYLRDHIGFEEVQFGVFDFFSLATYSLFQEYGFNHYMDGFIPGKYFMTAGIDVINGLLETGEIQDFIGNGFATVFNSGDESAILG